MKKQPMPMMKGMDMPPAMKKTMGKKKAAPKAPGMKKGGKVCGMKKGGKVC